MAHRLEVPMSVVDWEVVDALWMLVLWRVFVWFVIWCSGFCRVVL